jgi:hypothetical protein
MSTRIRSCLEKIMQDYTAQITQNYILYFILPFWFVVGFADYLCHRATSIERTSGLKESLIHALMFTEITIPVVLGLFFEITSLMLLVILVAYFVHEATAIWDVSYAQDRRKIHVVEQHIHSYLAVIPFMVASFVICLHWNDFVGLFGIGDAIPDFSLKWKRPQLSVKYHIGLNLAAATFLGAPYAEELWRCYRYQRRHGVPATADRFLG